MPMATYMAAQSSGLFRIVSVLRRTDLTISPPRNMAIFVIRAYGRPMLAIMCGKWWRERIIGVISFGAAQDFLQQHRQQAALQAHAFGKKVSDDPHADCHNDAQSGFESGGKPAFHLLSAPTSLEYRSQSTPSASASIMAAFRAGLFRPRRAAR